MPSFVGRSPTSEDPADNSVRGVDFTAGRGPVSVTSGNSLRLLGVNPAGSGKLVYITRFRVWASTQMEDMEYRVNPTTNLPTFSIPTVNDRIGGPAGVFVVTCDVGVAMSGGSAATYKLPIAEGSAQGFTDYSLASPFVIPPGYSLGASATNISGGPSNMTVVVDTRETPMR